MTYSKIEEARWRYSKIEEVYSSYIDAEMELT